METVLASMRFLLSIILIIVGAICIDKGFDYRGKDLSADSHRTHRHGYPGHRMLDGIGLADALRQQANIQLVGKEQRDASLPLLKGQANAR